MIEEIARLYGYNHFADTLPQKSAGGYLSVETALARRLREALRAAGLTELLHYSLTKPNDDRQVVLANPLFPEYSALRQDLIDGLLEAYAFNLNQGNGPLNGFELGHIFWQDHQGIHEAEAIGNSRGRLSFQSVAQQWPTPAPHLVRSEGITGVGFSAPGAEG